MKTFAIYTETFLPIRAPMDWNAERDIEEFEDRFGQSDHVCTDLQEILERNLGNLHGVLESGIHYFLRKRGDQRPRSVAGLSLEEKVTLFTKLLLPSGDDGYLLRFTARLAQVLWLQSERARILAEPDDRQWLYPLCILADAYSSAAFDLHEALACEHSDFRSQ